MGSFTVPHPPYGTIACEEKLRQVAAAVESRDVIGQAKGILMERHKISAGEAFDKLRDESMDSNRRLADVALDLTLTGSLDHW